MAHITLSIPDEVYKEMKAHPEIKWSEVARQNIIEKALHLKKTMHSSDLFKLLSPETQRNLETVNEKEYVKAYTQMKEKEWKRAKYLTPVQP